MDIAGYMLGQDEAEEEEEEEEDKQSWLADSKRIQIRNTRALTIGTAEAQDQKDETSTTPSVDPTHRDARGEKKVMRSP